MVTKWQNHDGTNALKKNTTTKILKRARDKRSEVKAVLGNPKFNGYESWNLRKEKRNENKVLKAGGGSAGTQRWTQS